MKVFSDFKDTSMPGKMAVNQDICSLSKSVDSATVCQKQITIYKKEMGSKVLHLHLTFLPFHAQKVF